MTTPANQVDAALMSRCSIRTFLPAPVARTDIDDACPQAAFTQFLD